jgi:hypothetical protein
VSSIVFNYQILNLFTNNSYMKGFGFPGKAPGQGNNNTPSYRADTSSHKAQLIGVLKRS